MAYITGVSTATGAGYFADNNGLPRLWVAAESWSLFMRAGQWATPAGNYQSDYDNFFSARAAQGVTVCFMDPILTSADTASAAPSAAGNTWDGVTPFITGTDPSSGLNSTFWTRIDYAVSSAAANGITIGFTFNLVYDTGTGGSMTGWTGTQATNYGLALGARYAASPNIIWMFGNDDFQGTHDSQFSSILTGLRNGGAAQITGVWWSAEYTSRHESDNNAACTFGQSNSAFSFCYSYNANYWITEYAYKETASPVLESHLLTAVLGDGYFYQGGSAYSATLDRAVRQEAWWALASGARGFLVESENVFPWADASALTAVSTNWFWVNNLPHIVSAYTGLTGWHLLIPDTGNVLVTGGRGTRVTGFAAGGSGGQYEPAFTNSYVAASRVADGSLAVAYLPNAATITIDQSKMAAGYGAKWMDPVTGATTAAVTGSSYNSTAQGSNSQGDPDWVLILASPPYATWTVP